MAGFLRHSDQLVVLWTPRYFSRLWCVYEVASWIHLGKDVENRVQVIPVAFALVLLGLQGGGVLYYITLATFPVHDGGIWFSLLVVIVPTVPILIVPFHVMRYMVGQLALLPRQIQSFSVRGIECFCCRHNHTHPDTGEHLLCDRRLVLAELANWFPGSAGRSTEEQLDLFDEHLRREFGHQVVQRVGGWHLTYWQALVTSAPTVFYYADLLVLTSTMSADRALRLGLFWLCVSLGLMPAGVKLGLLACIAMQRKLGEPQNRLVNWLLSLLLSLLYIVMMVTMWVPLSTTLKMGGSAPQLAIASLLAAIIAALFCSPWRWIRAACRPRLASAGGG